MHRVRERVTSHSISSAAREGETIRERAVEAGKPLSRYIVDRILYASDSAPDGEGIALSRGEQRAMRDALLRTEVMVEPLVAAEGGVDLASGVALLFEARLDEMVRIAALGHSASLAVRAWEQVRERHAPGSP